MLSKGAESIFDSMFALCTRNNEGIQLHFNVKTWLLLVYNVRSFPRLAANFISFTKSSGGVSPDVVDCCPVFLLMICITSDIRLINMRHFFPKLWKLIRFTYIKLCKKSNTRGHRICHLLGTLCLCLSHEWFSIKFAPNKRVKKTPPKSFVSSREKNSAILMAINHFSSVNKLY